MTNEDITIQSARIIVHQGASGPELSIHNTPGAAFDALPGTARKLTSFPATRLKTPFPGITFFTDEPPEAKP